MEEKHLFENTEFAGADLANAKRAIIFVHGRGDATNKMRALAEQIVSDTDIAFAFPKATNKTWYPKGFMASIEENQPWLDSAIENMGNVLNHIKEHGINEENIFILGFSQGACLAIDFAARNATKFAGVMVLSGGLIGPEINTSNYKGNFNGTEVLIGCSDVDHHIPVGRLHETEKVLFDMGANVDKRIYPGMDHIINQDEIDKIKSMIQSN